MGKLALQTGCWGAASAKNVGGVPFAIEGRECLPGQTVLLPWWWTADDPIRITYSTHTKAKEAGYG